MVGSLIFKVIDNSSKSFFFLMDKSSGSSPFYFVFNLLKTFLCISPNLCPEVIYYPQ